jgi:hypothetical protein
VRAALLATVLSLGGFLGWMVASGQHRGAEPQRAVATQPSRRAAASSSVDASGSPRLAATYARGLLGLASVRVAGPAPDESPGFAPAAEARDGAVN